ncbi:MAG: hypothetical protein LBM93_11305 [Oscillospiraceae bacterium]|jgi:hypothetical protein|nr:hypothetical protein [Oscillospiraceae bacterium]
MAGKKILEDYPYMKLCANVYPDKIGKTLMEFLEMHESDGTQLIDVVTLENEQGVTEEFLLFDFVRDRENSSLECIICNDTF